MPERATASSRGEKSAEVEVVGGSAGKARIRRRRTKREGVFEAVSMQQALRQKPARAGRARETDGEAGRERACDEACGPRREPESTGSALLAAALTRENLKQAFLEAHNYMTPEIRRELLGSETGRYVAADDTLYDPIRDTARILNLDLTQIRG